MAGLKFIALELSLFSRKKQRSKKIKTLLQLHLRPNPIKNTYRRISHRKWLLSMHVTNQLHDLLMLSLAWQKKIYSVKV